ncbi:MAG: type II toxin-antitoxin system prevent-host-death family antitoxin [Phycisphaerae bacterium]
MNIGIAEFRNNMADPINRAIYTGERVILTRGGDPAVALVSMEDLKLLEELENRADLKAALKARKEKGGITLEQAKARLEKGE